MKIEWSFAIPLQRMCQGKSYWKLAKKKSLINTAKYKRTMVNFQTTGTLLDKWNETF
jgi:hypothetical protein